MSIGSFFFSFTGRFNRGKFWLAVLGYLLISLIAAMIVPLILIGSGRQLAGGLSFRDYPVAAIVALLLYLVVLISQLAVYTKRLHDRDKSAWWLLVFWVIPGIYSIYSQVSGRDNFGSQPDTFAIVGALAAIALGIWALVELGCLRGTEGPNRFGPDPLGARRFGRAGMPEPPYPG